MSRIELGQFVTDPLTGFSGTVDGRSEYLYHAAECRVVGSMLQNGVPVVHWFPESRLTIAQKSEPAVGFANAASK